MFPNRSPHVYIKGGRPRERFYNIYLAFYVVASYMRDIIEPGLLREVMLEKRPLRQRGGGGEEGVPASHCCSFWVPPRMSIELNGTNHSREDGGGYCTHTAFIPTLGTLGTDMILCSTTLVSSDLSPQALPSLLLHLETSPFSVPAYNRWSEVNSGCVTQASFSQPCIALLNGGHKSKQHYS